MNVVQLNEKKTVSNDHAEEVNAIKQNGNREPPTKRLNSHQEGNVEFEPSGLKVVVQSLLQSEETQKRVRKKNARTTQGKKRREQAAKPFAERVEHYGLLSSVPQVDTGINIGQLLCGNAKEAEAVAQNVSSEVVWIKGFWLH